MMRTAWPATGLLCAAVWLAPATGAVGFQQQPDQKTDTAEGREMTVTGCLTARPDGQSYALTTTDPNPLAKAADRVTSKVQQTFTYELTGNVKELPKYAGQRVTVKGRLDEDRKKDMDLSAQREGSPRNMSKEEAKVTTKERAEIEVRRLQVASIQGSGEACGR